MKTSRTVDALDHGRACAVAAQGQRDLHGHLVRYPDLFPAGQFDPALVGMLTLNFACCAPDLSARQLRLLNRIGLWIFCADSALDARDGSPAELARRCLAVAGGDEPRPDESLPRFLADIRDELTDHAAFTVVRPVWQNQLDRLLGAMVREWEWATARAALPTYEEYLPVAAASIGLPLTYLSHWIGIGSSDHVSDVIAATMAAEPLLRLINDLGTYQRDQDHGDINAVLLDVPADEVRRQLDVLLARLDDELGAARATCPSAAVFIERQVGFNLGLYDIGDYRPGGQEWKAAR